MTDERDIGTKERHRHGKVIEFQVLEKTETGELKERAGSVVAFNSQECVLDALFQSKAMGEGRDGEARYTEALWLRELFLATHHAPVVGSYDGSPANPGAYADISSNTSPQMAWNYGCYLDTSLALRAVWPVLERTCCFDFKPLRMGTFLEAVDALVTHRGGLTRKRKAAR